MISSNVLFFDISMIGFTNLSNIGFLVGTENLVDSLREKRVGLVFDPSE